MTTFVTSLACRLTAHVAFLDDYLELRAASAARGIKLPTNHVGESSPPHLDRLLYCASILCQSESEVHLNFAQGIALSALIAYPHESVQRSAKAILASLGNFPGIAYIEQVEAATSVIFFENLRTSLLAAINTVNVNGKPSALTNFQLNVWRSFAQASVISVSAPTSAGKSFIVIEHLCQVIAEHDVICAVYLAPTRALIGEVQKRLEARLGSDSSVRITSVPALDPTHRPKQLYVVTQERLAALLSTVDLRVDIAVIDEGQSLADGTRGMILQDALERLRKINLSVEMIFLSPGVSGFPSALRDMGIDHVLVRETTLSPVLQNRILVRPCPGVPKGVDLELLEQNRRIFIARCTTARGMENADTRLAAVALELGGDGGSLVYATGPAEAEKICLQLALGLPKGGSQSGRVELSDFIKEHIHGDYGLAELVLHGVAFHYGKMPNLLREAIEEGFQAGVLRYMVCTTTLFQGVNLPARNVFIRSPVRGRGVPLEPAHLWNFAGRAGRLGRDVVGNVFLVDYDEWLSSPFDKPAQLSVSSALSNALDAHADSVISALQGRLPVLKDKELTRTVLGAAGYLMARAADGTARQLVERTRVTEAHKDAIVDAADKAVAELGLSPALLRQNWTVDPYGLARLQERLRQEVASGEILKCIPCRPSDGDAFGIYARMFNMVATEVLGYKRGPYGSFIAGYALPWMRGVPYPVLVAKWIKNERVRKKKSGVDSLIRGAFDFIEDTLRFQWVQLGKAYVHVLSDVLGETGNESRRSEIFDFSTALELGVSSQTGRSLMELGLSRISAAVIEGLFPDSSLTAEALKIALSENGRKLRGLSKIIVDELVMLELLND